MGSIKGALKGLVKVTGGILQFLGHLFSSLAGSNPFFAIAVIVAMTGGVIFAVVSINTYQNRMINAVINLHDFSVPDSFDYVERLTIIDDKSAIYASADDYNKRVLELIHWGDKKVTDEKELTDDEKEEIDNLEKDQDAIEKGLNGNSSNSDKIEGVKAAINNGRFQEAETILYLIVKDIVADSGESNSFYNNNGGKDILKKLKEAVEQKKDNLIDEDRKAIVNFLIDFYLHSDNKSGFANGETVTDIVKDGWSDIRKIVKDKADAAGLPEEWKVNDDLKQVERLKYDKEIEVKNTEKPNDNA